MTTIMITVLTLLLPSILLLATPILKCLNLDAIAAAVVLVLHHLDATMNPNLVGTLLMGNAVVEKDVDSLMLAKFVVIFYGDVAVVLVVVFLMTKVRERLAVIIKKACAIVVNHAVSFIRIRIKKRKGRKAMRQRFQKLAIPACKLARALKQMLALRRASNKRRGKMAPAAAALTS